MKKPSEIIIPILILFISYLYFDLYGAFIVTAFYLIVFLLFKHKEDISSELIVAIMFALFITSYHKYIYVGNNLFIGEINIYPLILWSLGLVLVREFYEYIGNKFWVTSVLYIVGILIVEYVGYHWFGIQTTGNNPGIWGTDIIHGPVIIHYFYILAGPLYLWVTKILNVK